MIIKIILLALLIGINYGYTNLVEPLLKNEIAMVQMENTSSGYVLMNTLPYIDKIWFAIGLILVFLIGIDLYRYFYERKGE